MRDDAGNVSILTLGWLVVAVLTLLVAAAASHVHLERVRLAALADEVALSAADALDVDGYYAGELATPTEDAAVAVDTGRMREAVERHVQTSGREWADQVVIVDVRSPDGFTAIVTIGRRVTPLFDVPELVPWSDGIEIVVEGRARAR